MPEISTYPLAGALTSRVTVLGDQMSGAVLRTVIVTNAQLLGTIPVVASGQLAVGCSFAFRTGVAALSGSLPALANVNVGERVRVIDNDFNAGVNNITITASAGETIQLGTMAAASSLVIDLNGGCVDLISTGSLWRAAPLAG